MVKSFLILYSKEVLWIYKYCKTDKPSNDDHSQNPGE